MTKSASDVESLKRAFADAGIDPTGIDFVWLAAFKTDTERKIAAARVEPAFHWARPTFVPPKTSVEARTARRIIGPGSWNHGLIGRGQSQ